MTKILTIAVLSLGILAGVQSASATYVGQPEWAQKAFTGND